MLHTKTSNDIYIYIFNKRNPNLLLLLTKRDWETQNLRLKHLQNTWVDKICFELPSHIAKFDAKTCLFRKFILLNFHQIIWKRLGIRGVIIKTYNITSNYNKAKVFHHFIFSALILKINSVWSGIMAFRHPLFKYYVLVIILEFLVHFYLKPRLILFFPSKDEIILKEKWWP